MRNASIKAMILEKLGTGYFTDMESEECEFAIKVLEAIIAKLKQQIEKNSQEEEEEENDLFEEDN